MSLTVRIPAEVTGGHAIEVLVRGTNVDVREPGAVWTPLEMLHGEVELRDDGQDPVPVEHSMTPSHLICDEAFFSCRCVLPVDHDPPDVHECVAGCGGSWRPDPSQPSGVAIVAFPSGVPQDVSFPNVGNPYDNRTPADLFAALRKAAPQVKGPTK